jgi:hypothetical protein
MHARVLPINIPLPDLSGEDAIEFTEFLYELAGRFEASYRDCINRYYRAANEHRVEGHCQTLYGTDPSPRQLELFDDLELF